MADIAVGIDLGTSNSVVSAIIDNKAVVIPDEAGRRIHPSVVSFHPKGDVLVGYEAKRRRIIDPLNTIYSAKRLIGQTFRAEQVQATVKRSAYRIFEGENQQPMVQARGKEFTIPQVSAFVLRYIKGLAERHIGRTIEDAVIAVPANFNDAQREATRLAGRLAGLNVMRILNEPTAAALAYGYGRSLTSKVVVYDFGGGTFDITTLQLDDKIFEVLSTAGDPFLGGDDIDELIVDHMVTLFLQQTKIDLRSDNMAVPRLRAVAEQIKCQLSSKPKAMVQVQEIAYGDGGQPLNLEFKLSVEQLSQMSRELVQRSFLICDDAMKVAGLSPTQIDGVVLVGGTTRMPLVQRSVGQYFNMQPHTNINPDEVVAVGAAIQAAALIRSSHSASVAQSAAGSASTIHEPPIDAVLLDVTPRALGIAVAGGFTEAIIERNVQIPVEQTRQFATSQDNQTTVRIQVCQGESNVFEENYALGELVLENLRPESRGRVRIEVTFEIDANGILGVSAVDTTTGVQQKARVNLIGTADESQITSLMQKQNEMPEPVNATQD